MMIVTLTGTNEYLIKQTVEAMAGQFNETHGPHSVEWIDGEELESAKLPELFQGMSLLASQRLVVLRDASKNKALWEVLAQWLERLAEGITLVIVDAALDKRTKTYKVLKKISDFRELNQLAEGELLRWMQQTAKSRGGELDYKVARYLVERIGSNQWQLQQELYKLASYQPEITRQTIDELVVASLQANVFNLLDAALGRRPDAVKQALATIAAHEDPYKLFGLLVAQVQALAVVRSAGKKSADIIAKEGGLHPFVVQKTQAFAMQTSSKEVKVIIEALANCDDQLKSTGVDPWFLVGQCLGRIASRR